MNEPDARLRNMLIAAKFLPVGVLPVETPDGDVVYWDTWLSLTHLHVPTIFRTVGYGGVVAPLYHLLSRLARSQAAFRACGLRGGRNQLVYDIAVRLAPDVTEIAEVKVVRTEVVALQQMILAAPLVPWFDPLWFDDDDDTFDDDASQEDATTTDDD
jgi:hypothetical protein